MVLSEVRLGDVIQLDRIAVQVDSDKEYSQIGIRSFGNGIFHRDPCLGSGLSKLKYFEVHPDRLVVSNVMAWEGAIAVSSKEEKGFVGSARFLSYRPIGEIDLRYLNYFFQSEVGKVVIKSVSTGTVTRNQTVSPRNFENAKVLLPDLAEQRRVADKLDAALDRWVALQSLRRNMSGFQSDLHESMIHSALASADDVVRMGDVVRLVRTEIDITSGESYRPIGMRGFGRGIIHYLPTPADELGKLRFYTFPERALALSNIKAWEGAISVTSAAEDGYIASNRFLFYLPVNEQVNVSYLRHYLLGRQGLAQISACSPGAADRNRTLGVKWFEGIEFRLPPRSVQDRVAVTLDAVNERLRTAYAEPALASLRPALLNAAFSGRL